MFNRDGFVQAYKTEKFELRQGHYATEVRLEVPDEAFGPPGLPVVSLRIPADSLRRRIEADVDGVPATTEGEDG